MITYAISEVIYSSIGATVMSLMATMAAIAV